MKQQPKKYLLLVLLVAVLVVPQFALAAWWNPLSWSFFQHIKSPSNPINTCTDSDGGINYYVAGQAQIPVTGPGHNPQFLDDNCKGNILEEAYCLNGHISSVTFACPFGCENSQNNDGRGSCIKSDQINRLKTYTNSQYKFSFQYPANYQIQGPNKNLLSGGSWLNLGKLSGVPDDILINYAFDATLDLSSSKYGPKKIYFDETTNQWIQSTPDNPAGQMVSKKITPRLSAGGLPIFGDHHGVYSQDIIALSHNTFIVIEASDSGSIADIIDNIASTFEFIK